MEELSQIEEYTYLRPRNRPSRETARDNATKSHNRRPLVCIAEHRQGYGHGTKIRLDRSFLINDNYQLNLSVQMRKLRDKTLEKIRQNDQKEKERKVKEADSYEKYSSTPLELIDQQNKPALNMELLRRLLNKEVSSASACIEQELIKEVQEQEQEEQEEKQKHKPTPSTSDSIQSANERRVTSPWSQLDYYDDIMDKYLNSVDNFFEKYHDRIISNKLEESSDDD